MIKAEWQRLIEECRASDMTAKAWCIKKGILYKNYVRWASKLNREGKPKNKQQWAALEIPKVPLGSPNVTEIRMECGRWKIVVGNGFDFNLLVEVMKAVNEIC